MVRIKEIAKAARDIIDSAKNGVPYSVTFEMGARLTKARIALTGNQWQALEGVLKERYELFSETWIIPRARRILQLIGESEEVK